MIVADAGPLIGLARVGLLELLRRQFGMVAVPPQVFGELQIESDRPGARALREAFATGWGVVVGPNRSPGLTSSTGGVDDGEAAAILLAEQEGSTLLIDERRGRIAARRRGLRILGTGGVLLAARRRGDIESVASALDALGGAGYRMAPALRQRLLELAGEA